MHQRNYEFLCDQLQAAGFPIDLQHPLSRTLESGAAEFQLDYPQTFETGPVSVTLHFQKSNRSEFYFLTHFILSMDRMAATDTRRVPLQRFPVYKNKSYTLREAYNLISGRAVHKSFVNMQGSRYEVWVQLDFTQTDSQGNYRFEYFYQQYGYDLEAVVEKFPLRELENPAEKSRLLSALCQGERGKATLIAEAGASTCFLEANPKFKSLKVFDESMQRLSNRALQAPLPRPDIPNPGPPATPVPTPAPDHGADAGTQQTPSAFFKLAGLAPHKQKHPLRKTGKKGAGSKRKRKNGK